MPENMRKIGMMMAILMGFTMSLVLSLTGTVSGGHFTVPSWLISFGISFVISLIIGFVVPIKKVGDAVCNKVNVVPESFKGNLVSAFISDLIYTPIITIIMVVIMVGNAAKHAPEGHAPSIGQVLPGSLILCFVVGYIVIAIIQPVFLKMLMKNIKR